MVFLGSSQTFLGVLATIVVMCVLIGENNFIVRILGLVKNQMAAKIEQTNNEITFKKLDTDPHFKLLRIIISNKEHFAKNNELTPKQQEDGIAILNELSIWKNSYQVESSRPVLNGVDCEMTLESFYTFLYILLVFFVDELLSYNSFPFGKYLVCTLALFSSFSSLFWIGKWIAFSYDTYHNNGKRTYSLLSTGKFSEFMRRLHRVWLRKSGIRIMIGITWFSLTTFLLCRYTTYGDLTWLLITVIGVIVPLSFEGIYKLYNDEVPEIKVDKGYGATFKQFICFLVLALLLSIILINIHQMLTSDEALISNDDFEFWKIFSLCYVVANGFILPFVVPYVVYGRLSNVFINKPNRIQEILDKEIDKRLIKVREFTDQVK